MRNRLAAALAGLALVVATPARVAAPAVTLPMLTVRLLPGTDPSVLHDLEHVRQPKGAEPVTLQLDLAHQQVLNSDGRIVAGADSVRPPYLQSVVDKWRYAASLALLARAHPQELHSDWGDEVRTPPTPPLPWVSGTPATFLVPHLMPGRQLLMFGIGPRGDIYYLSTIKLPSAPGPGDTMITGATAIPPFGAEHIVAVTAADPDGIRLLGAWLQENSDSRGVVDTQGEVLKQIEALKDMRIGLLPSYTCRMASECVR